MAGRKSIFASEFGNKDTTKYKANMEFLTQLEPWMGRRIPVISRALSFAPLFGKMFKPLEPFSKLNSDVDFSVIFRDDVIKDRRVVQKSLDALRLDKKANKITLDQFEQLTKVADKRHLDGSSLTKAFVTHPSMRTAKGDLINLNGKRSIGMHKIVGSPGEMATKLETIIAKMPHAHTKEAFLKRVNLKHVNFDRAGFEKIEKFARDNHLDVFTDMKLKASNIKTAKIDNEKLGKLIAEAVNTGHPLDLRCLNITKCNLDKALVLAEGRVGHAITIADIPLDPKMMLGTKMNTIQAGHFNKEMAPQQINQKHTVVKVDVFKSIAKGAVELTAAVAASKAYTDLKAGTKLYVEQGKDLLADIKSGKLYEDAKVKLATHAVVATAKVGELKDKAEKFAEEFTQKAEQKIDDLKTNPTVLNTIAEIRATLDRLGEFKDKQVAKVKGFADEVTSKAGEAKSFVEKYVNDRGGLAATLKSIISGEAAPAGPSQRTV